LSGSTRFFEETFGTFPLLFEMIRELDKKYEETLGAKIVAWGEACIRKTLAKNEPATLDASCREDYPDRISFLQCHGFRQTEDTSIHMTRLLSEPIPEPELPQGFLIRPIKGVEEAEAVASTHRAAFGTEYMTTESRLAIMNTSEYDPSLDLLVIAPDGNVAAIALARSTTRRKPDSQTRLPRIRTISAWDWLARSFWKACVYSRNGECSPLNSAPAGRISPCKRRQNPLALL
jgi:hypothetical protein